MNPVATTLAVVGPEGELTERLVAALASAGVRVRRVLSDAPSLEQLAHTSAEALLLGPVAPVPASWEGAALKLARARSLPVVAFGEDAPALARVSEEDGVVSALMPPWNGASVVTSVSANIAHHRRVLAQRDELTMQLGLFDAILHESPLAIYAKDPQMRFILSNRRHTQLIGKAPAEILGQTDEELFGAEGAAFDAMGRRVFQAGRGQSSEFDLELQGERRTFHETIFPIRLEGVRRAGIAAIASDLTEVRRQQSLLSLRVEELDQSRRVSSLTSECVELIQRSVSIEESLTLATRYLARMYPEANLAVYEKNDEQSSLALRAREERFGSFRPAELLEPHDCWALRTRRTYSAGAEGLRLRCRHLAASGAEACAPLFSLDRLVGLVSVSMPPPDPSSRGEDDRNARWIAQFETTVQSLAGALSTVALRESLNQLALLDEASALPNQRAFLGTLQRSLARAFRTREAVVVAAVELGHAPDAQRSWSLENDSRLIKQAAEVASGFFRADDALARLGARSLGVCLMLKSPDEVSERLSSFASLLLQQCRAGRETVTVAIGVGVAPPGLAVGHAALLEAAEQALAEARSGGEITIVRRELPGTASSRDEVATP